MRPLPRDLVRLPRRAAARALPRLPRAEVPRGLRRGAADPDRDDARPPRSASWSPTSTRSGGAGRERALSGAWDSDARARGARRRRRRGRGPVPRRHHRDEHRRRSAPASRCRPRASCPSCSGRARAPTTAGWPSSCRWRPSGASGVAIVPICWDVDEAVRGDPLGARARARAAILIPSHVGQARRPITTRATTRSGRRARSSAWSIHFHSGPRRRRTTSARSRRSPASPSCPARWASTSPRWCGGTCGRSRS